MIMNMEIEEIGLWFYLHGFDFERWHDDPIELEEAFRKVGNKAEQPFSGNFWWNLRGVVWGFRVTCAWG
jgi:hypothetical protein